jgi:hypothetical protein
MSPELEFHLLQSRCREMMMAAEADRLTASLASAAAPGPSLVERLRRLLWHPGLATPAAATTKATA